MRLWNDVEQLSSLRSKGSNFAVSPASNNAFAIRCELYTWGGYFRFILWFKFNLQKLVLVIDIKDLYLIKAKTSEHGAVVVWKYDLADFAVEGSHETSLVLEWALLRKNTVKRSLRSQDVNVVAWICETNYRALADLHLLYEFHFPLIDLAETPVLTADENAAEIAIDRVNTALKYPGHRPTPLEPAGLETNLENVARARTAEQKLVVLIYSNTVHVPLYLP